MRTVQWVNGSLRMIDQRLLPAEFRLVEYHDYAEVAVAIRTMVAVSYTHLTLPTILLV